MKQHTQHFLELLIRMTDKELRARYKQTVFGFIWLIINPVLQMTVIGFIFTFFMKEPIEHYYVYLFIGLLVWNFFSTSITKTTPSIVHERALIKKAVFPRSIIPISIILSNFIHLITALLLFMIPVLFINTYIIGHFIHVIVAIVLLLMLTIGLSLATCALNVRYRDINFIMQALLIPWFYATPIMYSFNQIPSSIIWIWRFNPLTSIIQLFQYAFLNAPLPGYGMISANVGAILLILVAGIWIFRNESKNFDDWI